MDRAPIVVIRFWQKPVTDNAGNVTFEDWVEYGPAGSIQTTTVQMRVKWIIPPEPDPNSSDAHDAGRKVQEMRARWAAIGPAYEAWKQGVDLPETGTPIGAWAALTPDQADVLRRHSLRTVEDVANLTDGQTQKIGLPNVRGLRDQARLFLETRDASLAARQMVERDERLAAQDDEIEDLKRQLATLLAGAKQGEQEPQANTKPASRAK